MIFSFFNSLNFRWRTYTDDFTFWLSVIPRYMRYIRISAYSHCSEKQLNPSYTWTQRDTSFSLAGGGRVDVLYLCSPSAILVWIALSGKMSLWEHLFIEYIFIEYLLCIIPFLLSVFTLGINLHEPPTLEGIINFLPNSAMHWLC